MVLTARVGALMADATWCDADCSGVVSNLAGSAPTYTDGKPDEMYQTIKCFSYPHDVCIDDEENLYIAQWNSDKVYPYKLTPVV